ncbi:WD40-repeat-containing domain protein [Thamnocephalis sphaerospora]|uniref:WD40-repeat-containing domain protein n=1 Tax=Thamnocephalis sphaerospora TaxID=78915 RepID=A0A4P9XW19_9FUNG|nr:WD40-repeat-containing domain protein [Thamnocephalis sphaerospora]|eukprot:RKP10494.1 WD40-repeat-containing domain protein [Thamnocephalis sphaerospora]
MQAPADVEFVQTPSASFLCPVCQDVYQDPLITRSCNHSFCSTCIFQSIEVEALCPLCRSHIRNDDLHPNLVLSNLVGELQVYCTNRAHGCLTTVRLDDLPTHMAQCAFTPVKCHHATLGCRFVGPERAVTPHLEVCAYEQLKPFIATMNDRVKTLEDQLQTHTEELETLRALLTEQSRVLLPSPTSSTIMTKQPSMDGISIPVSTNGTTSPEPAINGELAGLVSAGMRSTVDPWDSWVHGSIICRRTINYHASGVTSLCYGDDILFSGAHNGSIKVLNVRDEQKVYTLHDHRMSVWALAHHSDANRLFSAGKDGNIKAWDVASCLNAIDEGERARPISTLSNRHGKIYGLAILGDRLFSASSDKTIKVWDVHTLENTATFTGHNNNINSITPLHDGRIVTASSDHTLKIWDVATGMCTRTIPTQAEALDCAAGDGLLFASTYDALIHAFSLEDARPLARLEGHDWEVWQLAYAGQSGHGGSAGALGGGEGPAAKLFSASFDHTVRRWDTRMWRCDLVLRGHKGYVHAMTLGDGCLVTGCADKTIKVRGRNGRFAKHP